MPQWQSMVKTAVLQQLLLSEATTFLPAQQEFITLSELKLGCSCCHAAAHLSQQ